MKHAPIKATASGANIIVAPVANAIIRVCGFVLVGSGTVTAQFQSSGGTVLTGLMTLGTATVISAPSTPLEMGGKPNGWFSSQPGEGINLNLSGAAEVDGFLNYLVEYL